MGSNRRGFAVRHHGSCAVDQHGSQIRIAALADAQQPHPTPGTALPRHQAQPGGELAAWRAERII